MTNNTTPQICNAPYSLENLRARPESNGEPLGSKPDSRVTGGALCLGLASTPVVRIPPFSTARGSILDLYSRGGSAQVELEAGLSTVAKVRRRIETPHFIAALKFQTCNAVLQYRASLRCRAPANPATYTCLHDGIYRAIL